MKKDELLERLCKLTTKVNEVLFGDSNYPCSCFCGENPLMAAHPEDTNMDERIIKFIEGAVDQALLFPLPTEENMEDSCYDDLYDRPTEKLGGVE